ncbi:MAG: dTDP-4-dehydrorhamnose reductase family protein [Thermoanaerobaculales bacterium]
MSEVVVLGAAGMLGHKVFQILRERRPGTLATMREKPKELPFANVELLQRPEVLAGIDVTDFPRLHGLLQDLKPAHVVNCVGIIKQRREADDPIPSITINALLPHLLCRWAEGWGGRVIHVSTDCVFSGRRGGYREDDPSDAEDLYGKSKFLGEISGDNGLTLRTSIIGRELAEHRSLLDWFLEQEGKTVQGFTRVIYSGVTTNYLGRLVGQLIESHPTLCGLYQVASAPISKHDLLCLIKESYGMNVTIMPDATEVSDRSMVGEKFLRATGIKTPPWPELVRELHEDPTPYRVWIGR